MNDLVVKKANRRNVPLKLGITGASGSGKTFSALLLARGMVDNWNEVGLIDTENGSGELYANQGNIGEYQYLNLRPPFAPHRYIQAISLMEKSGVKICIVDSSSHEWDGEGGCLEMVEKLKPSMRNEFAAWGKVTPEHKKFLTAVLQSPMHFVMTTRRKQDYVLEADSRGKMVPKKVGMKEVQREGFEYELTVNFELDEVHHAKSSKDRTSIFADNVAPFMITEETGKLIRAWNDSGAARALPEPVPAPQPPQQAAPGHVEQQGPSRAQLLHQITQLGQAYVSLGGNPKQAIADRYKKAGTSAMTSVELFDFAVFLEKSCIEMEDRARAACQPAPAPKPGPAPEGDVDFASAAMHAAGIDPHV